jgi:hypothetical protein
MSPTPAAEALRLYVYDSAFQKRAADFSSKIGKSRQH